MGQQRAGRGRLSSRGRRRRSEPPLSERRLQAVVSGVPGALLGLRQPAVNPWPVSSRSAALPARRRPLLGSEACARPWDSRLGRAELDTRHAAGLFAVLCGDGARSKEPPLSASLVSPVPTPLCCRCMKVGRVGRLPGRAAGSLSLRDLAGGGQLHASGGVACPVAVVHPAGASGCPARCRGHLPAPALHGQHRTTATRPPASLQRNAPQSHPGEGIPAAIPADTHLPLRLPLPPPLQVIPCTKRFVHDWTICPVGAGGLGRLAGARQTARRPARAVPRATGARAIGNGVACRSA